MIERNEYLNQIRPLVGKHIIKVFTGVRRSGKSTLLKLIIKELKNNGVDENNIILIDFDSVEALKFSDITQVSDYIQDSTKNVDGKIYLFFDEVQRITQWERLVNAYFNDENYDVYVTGSNSKLLSGEFATYLTGRYVEIKVYPFSFKEYLEYYKDSNLTQKELFNQYIENGGMPSSFQLENKMQYLDDLTSSIINKDILQRFNVKNTDLLNNLFAFLLSNIGNLFSANSIHDFLKGKKIKVSINTIYNYLDYLQEACLIYQVKRYDVVGKTLLNHLEKYYVVDHGIRESIFNRNMVDIGQILENIVYFELLRRGYNVNVGIINKNEIDFVVSKNKEVKYIQVTYILSNEDVVKREFGNLLKIRDNYPKYVISMDEIDMSRMGVKHLNIIDFLLSDEF
ncbi:ATP-binding protein [Methanobrevibacter sp.]|uniref:ATP-binding protein n=1 Tax=Methanobrevibacter sp. TaxID=66852 RepID=UPI003868776E